ncbi:PIN-like domain-containing protein [Myxococcus sp. K15C18031901]|uniref:PIN-like domain-containing protein n=1 Tax=Myxococcus dinghuensis TaxID=2906761 RepID=UPI0020A8297F|nr:PIN-like domain-containing protein [Myxococcus dinghuensis]MCP3105470.1 PIN-like domain-containing protein [Myxococcus dinghuensis]
MAKTSDKPDLSGLTEEAVFLAETLLPDAGAGFADQRLSVADVLAKADVVLDTNVLLLPYRAGTSSLHQIEAALTPLRDDGRLFVPGRVAREFMRLRPAKLAELLQALSDQSSRIVAPEDPAYPLLKDLPEYRALVDAVASLGDARAAFIKAVRSLRDTILSWEGNDPVSVAYSRLFTPACIRDPMFDKSEVLKDLRRRVEHEIPPGYKDAAKSDGGVGDLLIWWTILELARERKRPLIFVTGEEKSDWQHRSGGRGFLPRFELVDEYRRASDGAAFYIIQMSELLELLQVEDSAVEEIKQEEQRSRETTLELVACPNCESAVEVELGHSIGSSAMPKCAACGARFHAHRSGEGVFARARGGAPRVDGVADVKVDCPYCAAGVSVLIGRNFMDSALPTCTSCGERFHAHRARDASVFTRRRGDRPPGTPDQVPSASADAD